MPTPKPLNPIYAAKRFLPLLGITALAVHSVFRNGATGMPAAAADTAGKGLGTGTSNVIDNPRFEFFRRLGSSGADVLTRRSTGGDDHSGAASEDTSLMRRQDPGYTPPPEGQGPVAGTGDFGNNGPVTPATGKPVPNHVIQTPAQMQEWLNANFPQPKLRVDPSLLKDQLFFENTPVAHLSNYKLLEALKYYDARDVYDALMMATGKDKLGLQSNPELAEFDKVRTNAGQSTAILLAYWALSNHYGDLADLPKVDSQPGVGLLVGKTPFPPLHLLEGGSGAGGVEKHGGRAWIDVADITDTTQIAAHSYHQLLRAITNDKWRSTAGTGALEHRLEEIGKSGYAGYLNEIINQFLSRQWEPGFTSVNDTTWNAQANMNAVVAALSRGETQLRDEDFVDGPTPESSATGMDVLRKAVVGGEDEAMAQLLQGLERLLESDRVPASANQRNLQTELSELLASVDATDSQGLILNAILEAPVEQLQAVLNNNKTMAMLGETLQPQHAVAYTSALFNYGLEHSDLIGQRDLLDWFDGNGREPDTFSGQFWCCDLPAFAAYKAGLQTQEEADTLHNEICQGKSAKEPWSPGSVPPIGSMVTFVGGGFHVAVSLGKATPDGKAMVASIALAAPNQNVHTQITTIEDLQKEYPDDVITYGIPPRLKTDGTKKEDGDEGAQGELPLWGKIVIGLGAATVLTAAAAACVYSRRRGQADAVANRPVSVRTAGGELINLTVRNPGEGLINIATNEPVLPQFIATPPSGDVLS